MPHVLVDNPTEPQALADLARATGLAVERAPGELGKKREVDASALADVRAILCTFLPTNLSAMPKLELVQLCSAGFAQVENLGLGKRGIHVCTASGVNDVPISEWAITMMVALARDLPQMFRNQQQGVWDRAVRFQQEIRGRTLGIWGYGGIGRETARLAKAFGLRVHVLTRSGKVDHTPRFRVEGTGDDIGAYPDRLFAEHEAEAFVSSVDFLMLAIPETPSNRGLINRRLFEAMRPTAYLLNPARGPLVNEADLLWALESGKIAGAALDTHYYYPMPADHPLWRMPNVIMTPHISGSSQSTNFAQRLWELFGENVRRWQRGEPLFNELTASKLDPASGV